MKNNYEAQLKKLQNELFETQKRLEQGAQKSVTALEIKKQDLEKALEGQKETCDIIKQLENEIKELQKNEKEILMLRDQMQGTLNEKNAVIECLKMKNFESKMKVNEALQIVDTAIMEKDAAILRENQAKGKKQWQL